MKIKFFFLSFFIFSSCAKQTQVPQSIHQIQNINEEQKKIAEKIIEENDKKLSGKVVTKLSMVKNYCLAEKYHQRYLEKK